MKLCELLPTLEAMAPPSLAEEWDNVGLLVGDLERPVKRVFFTIDLTNAVLTEAIEKKTDLVVAYHPPLFRPIKRVVADQGSAPWLYRAISHQLAVYSLHTALDYVRGGLNDVLAEIVGIAAPRPLHGPDPAQNAHCKLVVFVPANDLEVVSEAMFAAGAGVVGPDALYTKCAFRTQGVGTFKCGRHSNPAIGQPGSFEQVTEYRLETIVPKTRLAAVIDAMVAAHSYEEVAYDVYPLLNTDSETGLGRWGDLAHPMAGTALVETIKKALKVKTVGVAGGTRRKLRRAAVGAGAGGGLVPDVLAKQCDVFLTGELKHHDALALAEAGVMTVCVGHSNSERVILPLLARRLREASPDIDVVVSRKDHDPFTWG